MKNYILAAMALPLILSCGGDDNIEKIRPTPTKAILLFPENISECVEGTILSDTQSEVTFQWTASDHTDHYDMQLTNLVSNVTDSYSTDNTELPVTLARGTPYSWQITSINGSGSQTSDLWSFYNAGESTEYFIPFPAANIAPTPATTYPSTQSSVTLEWEGNDLDGDILDYDVYFGDTETPALYQENHAQTTLSNIPLVAGNIYYWRILTRDSMGNESMSGLFDFEVENP